MAIDQDTHRNYSSKVSSTKLKRDTQPVIFSVKSRRKVLRDTQFAEGVEVSRMAINPDTHKRDAL